MESRFAEFMKVFHLRRSFHARKKYSVLYVLERGSEK